MKSHIKTLSTIFGALALFAAIALTGLAQGHQHGQQEQKQCEGCKGGMGRGSGLGQGQGQGQGQGSGQGMMGRGMGMGQGGRMEDMQTIHSLFDEHKKVNRTVTKTENGVVTVTESDDPKVQAMIVEHVWAMKSRLEKKQPIRMWDPLYRALFEHADKIKMEIVNTEKGVKITETTTDPYVVKLLHSHSDGVSEFVAEGMSVMHKRHELPGEKVEESAFLGKGDGITTCPVTGEPVNKEVRAEIWGRTVYFCCENCKAAVLKAPEKYLKK